MDEVLKEKVLKKCYISGKISGLTRREAWANFDAMEKKLESKGFVPINPMKIVEYRPDKSWGEYMVEDLKILMQCDCICMLPNWGQSNGAKIEHDFAKKLGLQIYYARQYGGH